jgi:hypothetical protein
LGDSANGLLDVLESSDCWGLQLLRLLLLLLLSLLINVVVADVVAVGGGIVVVALVICSCHTDMLEEGKARGEEAVKSPACPSKETTPW